MCPLALWPEKVAVLSIFAHATSVGNSKALEVMHRHPFDCPKPLQRDIRRRYCAILMSRNPESMQIRLELIRNSTELAGEGLKGVKMIVEQSRFL